MRAAHDAGDADCAAAASAMTIIVGAERALDVVERDEASRPGVARRAITAGPRSRATS